MVEKKEADKKYYAPPLPPQKNCIDWVSSLHPLSSMGGNVSNTVHERMLR